MAASGQDLPARRRGPLPTRLLERGTEEALVRALESEAVERAIIRVLESETPDRLLAHPAVERAVIKALDSRLVDDAWDHLLASEEAQKLVERIANAPEIRAALTSQGVGLIEDLGRGVRDFADHFDEALERVVGGVGGRTATGLPRPDVTNVGLVTRTIGALLDGAIINLAFLAISAIFGVTIGGVIGDDQSPSGAAIAAAAVLWSGAGGLYLGVFWALAGQTLGMRFLSIRLDVDGERRIGARRAVRRLIGTALSVLTLGVGFVVALFDGRRRTWADRLAGTEVVESDRDTAAPHSR
jgi:uncharacterized RDD family membrane protein YckC